MKNFIVDVTKCTGCYCCQMACKDEHCGNDWTPYAKPQPETGQFWGKIHEFEMGQQPHVRVRYVFVPCQHCNSAPCIDACPIEAIYRDDNGFVIIDPKACSGCQLCMDSCPYRVIFYNETLQIAQKCTGCAHLIDKGWADPRCVDVCHQLAIEFGDDLDFSGTETWQPDFNLDTNVRYIGLPKKFVAGTAYDPTIKEVVEGATCTLAGTGGPFTTTTNEYGDFWFEGLVEGEFTLTIEDGGKSYTETVSTVDGAKSVGDVALS